VPGKRVTQFRTFRQVTSGAQPPHVAPDAKTLNPSSMQSCASSNALRKGAHGLCSDDRV